MVKVNLPADLSYRERPEVESHDYQVVFWEQQGPPPPGVKPEAMGYSELTYEVSGAEDVMEVIDWAEKEAIVENSTYCIYVKVPSMISSREWLLQIAGVNPTVDKKWTEFRRRHPKAIGDKQG
jgi:hypothetical protein